MKQLIKNLLRNKKGAALVEYGLLVAGVALVTAAAVSIFSHKTNDLMATTAGAMQGVPEDIVRRQIVHFHRADPAYGAGVARRMGIADPVVTAAE